MLFVAWFLSVIHVQISGPLWATTSKHNGVLPRIQWQKCFGKLSCRETWHGFGELVIRFERLGISMVTLWLWLTWPWYRWSIYRCFSQLETSIYQGFSMAMLNNQMVDFFWTILFVLLDCYCVNYNSIGFSPIANCMVHVYLGLSENRVYSQL